MLNDQLLIEEEYPVKAIAFSIEQAVDYKMEILNGLRKKGHG